MSVREPDIASFEESVREAVREIRADTRRATEILASLFGELSASVLPLDEVARRARRIVESLPTRTDLQRAAALAAGGAAPAVRTAVVSVLPPELQRLAYAAPEGEPDVRPSRAPNEAEGELPAVEDEPAVVAEVRTDAWHTVFLLGDRQESDSNSHFLAARGFKAIRVATAGQLNTLARESCCGMVMHASWWQGFADSGAAATFVVEQMRTSNVLFYRLDLIGLAEPGLLATMLAEFDASIQARIQIGAGSELTDFDVARFERVAALLKSADVASIGIEGITDSERRLLATSAALFEAEERGNAAVGPTPVKLVVSPMVDGRSGARVVKVRVEGQRLIFVVKLDTRTRLQEELERAKRVMPVSQAVHMKLYSLGGDAVLIQRLAAQLDQQLEGAPSLKERLLTRSSWERGRRVISEPLLTDLEIGVGRLIETIKTVNSVAAAGDGAHCWMGVEPLEFLADLGIRWRIESDDGDFDPGDILPWVRRELAELSDKRLVHGDLHSGNVLLLDDRTPQLIDFALAGAGHPCFDLVRMSSAIAYSALRPLTPEPELRAFFKRVHLDGAAADALCGEFPDLMAGVGSRIAARVMTLSREAGLAGLVEHGRGEDEYLAMVYLVGAQSLTMDEFQGVVVRASLGAVFPRLRRLAADDDDS